MLQSVISSAQVRKPALRQDLLDVLARDRVRFLLIFTHATMCHMFDYAKSVSSMARARRAPLHR